MWSFIVSGIIALAASKNITPGQDCYRVTFEKESVKHIVDYKLDGSWRNTIRIYNEAVLPSDIRRAVKTQFTGSEIVLVNELRYGNVLAHFIKIRQHGWCKTVKVSDGELTVVEEFKEQ